MENPRGYPASILMNISAAVFMVLPITPAVCAALRPDPGMCGSNRQEALLFLSELERETCPQD